MQRYAPVQNLASPRADDWMAQSAAVTQAWMLLFTGLAALALAPQVAFLQSLTGPPPAEPEIDIAPSSGPVFRSSSGFAAAALYFR